MLWYATKRRSHDRLSAMAIIAIAEVVAAGLTTLVNQRAVGRNRYVRGEGLDGPVWGPPEVW